MNLILASGQILLDSATDVLPIAVFLFLFQRLVIGKPMPDGKRIILGFVFVVVGLGCFLV